MRRGSSLAKSVYKVVMVAAAVCALHVTSKAVGASRESGEESELGTRTGFVYKNRWQNHNQHHSAPSSPQDLADLNTIDDFSDPRAPSTSSSNSINHEPSQRYACGQPLANRKPLVLDRGDQYPSSSSSSSGGRSKYRPFEIRMPRIIGGDETDPGEFPWTVSVKLNGQPICGGSLIDESWILTAAHCVVGYNPRNLTVRLGAYRIKDTSERQTVDSPLSLFIVHKEYSMPRPFSNDIALLKMAEPVRYSDYIIPICLPTEDQASASGDLLQDYNRMSPAAPSSSLAATATASDGIVISTKMSDKEISRCFKRLEQNYLNSIGLGATNSADASAAPEDPIAIGTATTAPVPSYAVAASSTGDAGGLNHPNGGNHYNSMTADLVSVPQKLASTHKTNGDLRPVSSMFVHSTYDTPTYLANTGNEIEPQTSGQDKVSFASSSSSSSSSLNDDQFDPTTAEYTSQTFATITNNQHQQSLPSHNRNRLVNNHAHTNYLQHGLPLWDQLQSRSAGGQFDYGPLEGQQKPAIKLTSLPISKELLREIQSVGSMQSLNLGLQQGDIVAMASDLGGTAAASPPADSLISGQLPIGNAANNRERVVTTGDGGTRRAMRNPVRASEFTNDLGDGSSSSSSSSSTSEEEDLILSSSSKPSRYSGISGIVVGWGWVRENDNDEQVGTTGKGFQSVTLQKVRLPILRNNECEAWFRSQEKKITLLPSQFCAGFNLGGKDACRGDSGGPMIIEDNSDTGRYKLIGIVSAGIGCARPSLPGLYTRVASFLPWINAQMTRY